jgi:hypothetical protein
LTLNRTAGGPITLSIPTDTVVAFWGRTASALYPTTTTDNVIIGSTTTVAPSGVGAFDANNSVSFSGSDQLSTTAASTALIMKDSCFHLFVNTSLPATNITSLANGWQGRVICLTNNSLSGNKLTFQSTFLGAGAIILEQNESVILKYESGSWYAIGSPYQASLVSQPAIALQLNYTGGSGADNLSTYTVPSWLEGYRLISWQVATLTNGTVSGGTAFNLVKNGTTVSSATLVGAAARTESTLPTPNTLASGDLFKLDTGIDNAVGTKTGLNLILKFTK